MQVHPDLRPILPDQAHPGALLLLQGPRFLSSYELCAIKFVGEICSIYRLASFLATSFQMFQECLLDFPASTSYPAAGLRLTFTTPQIVPYQNRHWRELTSCCLRRRL